MHRQVRLRSQKINSFANDNLVSQEIDKYLNMAINQFVKDRIDDKSNALQTGFEESLKRYEDLKTLVIKDEALTITHVPANTGVGIVFVDRGAFPDDHLFLLSLRCKIQYARDGVTFTVVNSKREIDGVLNEDYLERVVLAKRIQTDDIYALLGDPFNKASIKHPVYDISSHGLDIYTDSHFIVDEAYLNYIREPVTVLNDTDTSSNNVDCDLPEFTHDEIVDLAVKSILSDIDKFGADGQLQDLMELE